jgi:hypothetical protein
MKRSICAAALLAMGIGLAGTAQAATDPAVCLQPNRFYSWHDINDTAVVVTDRARKDYKLTLEKGCYDIDFSLGLGIKSFSSSPLACVTRNDYVLVPRRAAGFTQRCRILNVEAYTPDMAKADALAKAAAKNH